MGSALDMRAASRISLSSFAASETLFGASRTPSSTRERADSVLRLVAQASSRVGFPWFRVRQDMTKSDHFPLSMLSSRSAIRSPRSDNARSTAANSTSQYLHGVSTSIRSAALN